MSYSNWKAPASHHKPGLPSDRTLLEFAQELRAHGASFAEIGRRVDIGPESVRHAIKRNEPNGLRRVSEQNHNGIVTPRQWQRIAGAYGVTSVELQELRRLGLTVRAARELLAEQGQGRRSA